MVGFIETFARDLKSDSIKLWKETQHNFCIQNHSFPKDAKTDIISSKGSNYTNSSIWFCHKFRHKEYEDYVSFCHKNGIRKVHLADRKKILKLLKKTSEKVRSNRDNKRSNRTLRNEFANKKKLLKLAIGKESVAYDSEETRTSGTLSSTEKFDFMKRFEKVFKENKPLWNGEIDRNCRPKELPIILVPNAVSFPINIYNAKEFFKGEKFSEVEKKLGETKIETIENEDLGRFEIKDQIKNSDDWDRVIAVVVTGKNWQFKKYKYKPPLLFSHVKGFYFQWEDHKTEDLIKKWKLDILKLSRKDRPHNVNIMNEFWKRLRLFLRKNRKKNSSGFFY